MENENGFQAQSLVNCAGADIQAHIKESGERCSDGHEWRTDGASQIPRVIFTTITGQNSSLFSVADWILAGKTRCLDFG